LINFKVDPSFGMPTNVVNNNCYMSVKGFKQYGIEFDNP